MECIMHLRESNGMGILKHCVWFFISLVLPVHAQEPAVDSQDIHIYVVNANTQTLEVNTSMLGLACWHYTGAQLCACLQGVCQEDRNKNMLVLIPEQRTDFFMQSMQTIEDYQQFCNNFSAEQWRQFYYNMSEKEKRFFPENQEQVTLLVDALEKDATIHEAFLQSKPTSIMRKVIACSAGIIISPLFFCVSWASNGFKQGIQQAIHEIRNPFLEGKIDQEKLKTLFIRFKNYAFT